MKQATNTQLDQEMLDRLIKEMKECQENTDTEVAHSDADGILCNALERLGYDVLCAEYYKVKKWYA